MEVCYLGEDLPSAEGPFLIEEHRLLTSIALRVGNVIERLQVEEEKGELQAHLHQAQKMEAIGVLAGGIAHDFNNILAIVLGFSEMALDDAQPDSQSAKDFAMVVAAAHRAKDLVAQILAFSRQSSVECMLLRVQPLVKESLKMLRASLPSTITIKENIFPQCGAILADPTQVHQIVMNLCTNAFHAMEHSGGTLSVGLKPRVFDQQLVFAGQQLTAGEYVELTVSDTGCGIEPEIMAKIFDPYFTTKEVGKGTGMGLSISQGIIRSYGGIITLESTLGQGTTFRVLFPVIHEEIKAVAEEEAPARGSEHILLVDDEEAVCAMGKAVLGRLGYIVTTHSRSNEALAAFAENPARFDLVISDQTMPGLTGIELARQLLAIRPELPIILCTGFSNQIDEASAKVIGIRELAVKPINLVTFGNLVRKVLDGG